MKFENVLLMVAYGIMLTGIVLLVVHFTTASISDVWGGSLVMIGGIVSLIALIVRHNRKKRAEKDAAREERHRKKHMKR